MYIYLSKLMESGETIGGILFARSNDEALHNAQIEARERGGDIRLLVLDKID